jgi:hypothetical protein
LAFIKIKIDIEAGLPHLATLFDAGNAGSGEKRDKHLFLIVGEKHPVCLGPLDWVGFDHHLILLEIHHGEPFDSGGYQGPFAIAADLHIPGIREGNIGDLLAEISLQHLR